MNSNDILGYGFHAAQGLKKYKVAHSKLTPQTLSGKRKKRLFFRFLKFFPFCPRMKKKGEKKWKNRGEKCKILQNFFLISFSRDVLRFSKKILNFFRFAVHFVKKV